ncbi:MAG TPA: DUF4097 domain-containing protein [Clostridiaceae bacterium]|nr:DUF4097 domain-containing protein [Clostridiaceae bacterium]
MKLRLYLLVLILFLVVMSGCSVSTNFAPKKVASAYSEECIEVEYPLYIDISSDSGNINIFSWNRDEVKFEITKKIRGIQSKEELTKMLENFNIITEKNGKRVVFSSVYQGSAKNPSDKSVDVRVYIPKKVDSIDIKLDTGTIKFFDDIRSEVNLNVDSVNVDINKLIGKVILVADMGNLRISGGKLESGSSVKTNFGNISVKAELEESGEYYFGTNIGSIDLSLPEGTELEVEAKGSIRSNEFEQCFSGAKIKLESKMGDISLMRY